MNLIASSDFGHTLTGSVMRITCLQCLQVVGYAAGALYALTLEAAHRTCCPEKADPQRPEAQVKV